MVRLFPLVDNIDNLGLADCSCLVRTNHKVIDLRIIQLKRLVGINALVLSSPKGEQLAQGASDNLVKLGKNVASMPSCEFHRIGENQVVTDKRSVTCTESCGEALVMCVTQSNDCASLGVFPCGVSHLKQAKVAFTTSCEVVAFVND